MAVLLDNLGSMSEMEMNILSGEVIAQLEERGVVVTRVYCGRFITSQEMPGFSISILHMNQERCCLLGTIQKLSVFCTLYGTLAAIFFVLTREGLPFDIHRCVH